MTSAWPAEGVSYRPWAFNEEMVVVVVVGSGGLIDGPGLTVAFGSTASEDVLPDSFGVSQQPCLNPQTLVERRPILD